MNELAIPATSRNNTQPNVGAYYKSFLNPSPSSHSPTHPLIGGGAGGGGVSFAAVYSRDAVIVFIMQYQTVAAESRHPVHNISLSSTLFLTGSFPLWRPRFIIVDKHLDFSCLVTFPNRSFPALTTEILPYETCRERYSQPSYRQLNITTVIYSLN